MLWVEADRCCGWSLGSRARPWWSYDGVVELGVYSITTASSCCCVRGEALPVQRVCGGY